MSIYEIIVWIIAPLWFLQCLTALALWLLRKEINTSNVLTQDAIREAMAIGAECYKDTTTGKTPEDTAVTGLPREMKRGG